LECIMISVAQQQAMEPDFTHPQLIMVYGTLKKGHSNNDLLQFAAYLGECKTRNSSFILKESGCPMVYLDPNGFRLKGELYLVSPEDMLHVDMLEGHPRWYRRHRVPLDDGTLAWLYIMPNRDDTAPWYGTERMCEPKDGVVEWNEVPYVALEHTPVKKVLDKEI